MRKSATGYALRVPSNGRKHLSRAEPMAVAVQGGRARRGTRVDVHAVLRDEEVVLVAGRTFEVAPFERPTRGLRAGRSP